MKYKIIASTNVVLGGMTIPNGTEIGVIDADLPVRQLLQAVTSGHARFAEAIPPSADAEPVAAPIPEPVAPAPLPEPEPEPAAPAAAKTAAAAKKKAYGKKR